MIHRFSILRRLALTTTFIAGMNVLLVYRCFLAYSMLQYQQNLAHQIEAVGAVISSNSAASLAFSDARNAGRILQALQAQPQVREACIFTLDGDILASFATTPSTAECERNEGNAPGWVFEGNEVRVHQDIVLDAERLGRLVIV